MTETIAPPSSSLLERRAELLETLLLADGLLVTRQDCRDLLIADFIEINLR